MEIRKLMVAAILVVLNTFCFAQSDTKEESDLLEIEINAELLVKAQLDAYNNRNIEEFLEPYSDSVRVYNYPNQFLYQGKKKMREGYAKFFENTPKLNCNVVSRMILGNKVIDREEVTGIGQNGDDVLNAIAIYTIERDKISEVRFLRR